MEIACTKLSGSLWNHWERGDESLNVAAEVEREQLWMSCHIVNGADKCSDDMNKSCHFGMLLLGPRKKVGAKGNTGD